MAKTRQKRTNKSVRRCFYTRNQGGRRPYTQAKQRSRFIRERLNA